MLSVASCCLTCASCWKHLGYSKIAATESLDSAETSAASTAADTAADTAAEKAADMAADMAADTEGFAETLLGGFQCRENECPDRCPPPSLDYLLQDDGVDKPMKQMETLLQTKSWYLNQTINQVSKSKKECQRVLEKRAIISELIKL